MIIDNAGFDVAAMAKLKQKEFVELHMSNKAICYGKTEEEKTKWLQDAHAAIVAANGATAKAGATSTSKPGKKD